MKCHPEPFEAERIFDDLPPPLSERELLARYGASMERARMLVHDAVVHPAAADVAISAARHSGLSFLRVLNHAADIVAEALQPRPAPVFASRALGSDSAEVSGAAQIRISRKSEICRLIVSMETSNGKQNIRVFLEDVSGRRLSPVTLTVGDVESGKTLLSEKSFASGEALLRDVEPGEYSIVAESGDACAALTARIEDRTI